MLTRHLFLRSRKIELLGKGNGTGAILYVVLTDYVLQSLLIRLTYGARGTGLESGTLKFHRRLRIYFGACAVVVY